MFHSTCRRNKIKPDGHFVGRTIFWIRFSILKKAFKHIDLEGEYSICEPGKPSEPSYTHTWERIFGLIVSTQGFKITGAYNGDGSITGGLPPLCNLVAS